LPAIRQFGILAITGRPLVKKEPLMSAKRPSLAESMRQAVQINPPSSPEAIPGPRLKTPSLPEPGITARPTSFYAATRAGKKKVTAALDPTTHKQLKSLAVDKEVTTEALLTEAISDLLTKHGINRST
jgi:hypothetical protein